MPEKPEDSGLPVVGRKRREPTIRVTVKNPVGLGQLLTPDAFSAAPKNYSGSIRRRAEEKRVARLEAHDREQAGPGRGDSLASMGFNSQVLLNRAAEPKSEKPGGNIKTPAVMPNKKEHLLRLNKSLPALPDFAAGTLPPPPIRPRDKTFIYKSKQSLLAASRLVPLG